MARILIVDDQAGVRALMRDILEEAGHSVIEARDGAEAMRLSSDKDDLVVTDVFMPERDGIEVLRHVKQMKRRSPVLVITGSTGFREVDFLKIARALGADRVLRKLEIRSQLLSVVTELLAASRNS